MSDQTQETPNENSAPEEEVIVAQSNSAQIIDETAETTEEQDPKVEEAAEEERKYADKYTSVEDLEKAYKESQREYQKLLQERNAQSIPAAQTTSTQEESDLDPEVLKQLTPYVHKLAEPLVENLAKEQNERSWSKLKAEYGDDIQARIAEHFETLSPEEQNTLNNPAGARMIAQLLQAQGSVKATQKSKATQVAGTSKSHKPQGSNLTRAKILSMSKAEYDSRIGEIQQWYAENTATG